MTSSELREAYLRYFEARDHRIVASSPLVPGNDPTLLFTNAGMVQFKDVFLGEERRDYRRATSSQRCVRAGGKHNDLENVGYTARHHTFFEMLGNFSFGDYFKREAIQYAWEFVTEVLGIPPGKLWVTVFRDDDEAAAIWLDEIGVAPERFSRMGEKDNFWAMGDTGPCGPCSEIFYDHGPDVAGGPPGSPDEDGDRYIEIWNLVFMQYQRSADGNLTPLPRPSVDTGMGLERVAALLQGVHSNYEIDLFARLIDAIAGIVGTDDRSASSLKVIADHIRACAFLIVDGVLPGNEGRGYVLRRIIRRAIRHGYKLGVSDTFFYRAVAPLCDVMGDAYPELRDAREHVERILEKEERRFAETLSQGMGLLEEAIAGMSGRVIPGDVAFRLYDTFGFPVDLTADIARERDLSIDMTGFEAAMAEQRERAKAASKFARADDAGLKTDAVTEFSGYEHDAAEGTVTGLYVDGAAVERIDAPASAVVVLDTTPFYAESGGQVGDSGYLVAAGGYFAVADTRKSAAAHLHVGELVRGTLALGDTVSATVDAERRDSTRRNHSATHLLHAALREILGEHVQQKGSLVAPDRLRFDFSHYEPLTAEQIAAIEDRVNGEILDNHAAETAVMPFDEAV
ncbi:MAG: alanine--tRNA ligase, partial [Pseudomonadota bacterium]